jgi:tryptophan 2,3-dioxygenase
MPVTYSSYLKLDELLSLQQPLSKGPEHDEMLFIIIHQVYELWFKEVIYEMDYLQRLFAENKTSLAQHTLKRVLTILKVMVAQLDILETMTPLEFLSFRDRLESGSGFQSSQFRELEFLLGLKNHKSFSRFPQGSQARQQLEMRYERPSLWDSFLQYLAFNNYDIPQNVLSRDLTKPVRVSKEVQKILIDIYRNNSIMTQICERLVDLDEGFQEWRYRHVKMVQRTIGTKHGTGGSAGAEYLMKTLNKPVFPDLWAIRTEL